MGKALESAAPQAELCFTADYVQWPHKPGSYIKPLTPNICLQETRLLREKGKTFLSSMFLRGMCIRQEGFSLHLPRP